MDFSANPMYEPTFEFYDKTLLDDVNRGVAHVHEFFRLLALCHTVMPEYKDGNFRSDQLIHLVFSSDVASSLHRAIYRVGH